MNDLKNGLFFRILWAGFGIALALNSVNNFSSSMNYGDLIVSIGWLLMAVSWFMRPLILKATFNLPEIIEAQSSYGIGSPRLGAFCTFGGFVSLVIGSVLKLLNAS